MDPQSVQFGLQVAPQKNIKWTLLKVSIGRVHFGPQMAKFCLQDTPSSAQVDFQSVTYDETFQLPSGIFPISSAARMRTYN